MKVVFLHANFGEGNRRPAHHDQKESDLLAELVGESVRRSMPGAEIVQLTDEKTPAVEGCTVVRRQWKHDNPMLFRMEHFAEIDGEFLALDTDCIVQADVSGVFSLPFDVALTIRDKPVIDPKSGKDLSLVMPFNTGVIFSRNRDLWRMAVSLVPENLGWYSDQLVMPKLASKFNVLKLHCDNFNYTPQVDGEDVSGRLIVHYKGKWRKHILNNPIWGDA